MAEVDEIINEPSDSQKRITQLSGKVKEEAEAKEAALKVAEEAQAKVAEAERAAAFSEGFVDIVAENPAAKEHKDEIKAKVLSGYTVQDATFAVLGAAGKLGQAKVESFTPTAGGSATTNIPQNGTERSVAEMTQAERREELAKRADLFDLLAPRTQR